MTKPKVTSTTTLREYVESLLVTIILALFGTTFLVQAFKIPSSSMEKTLLVGDHLLVNKFLFAQPEPERSWLPYREVRRGDIVVFKYPFPPHQHFVKRVIGLPGDRLKVVDQQVYINGEPLEEPYKIHERPRSGVQFGDTFPVTDGYVAHWMGVEWAEEVARLTENDELLIPSGKYFVMGDNRDNSQDSRYWGFADRTTIIGRPLVIYWSFASNPERNPRGGRGGVGQAITDFFSRARWKRFFHLVR